MLQTIRNYAGSWIVKLLFLLLVASFAIWGVVGFGGMGDALRGRNGDVVATVGSEKIHSKAVYDEFRGEMERMRRMYPGQMDVEQAKAMGLLDRALYDMISRVLIEQEADRVGFVPGQDLIVDQIRHDAAFRDKGGNFDPNIFRQLLASADMSEAAYIDYVRRQLARTTLVNTITDGIVPSKLLVDTLYAFENEQRVVEILRLPAAAMPLPAGPDRAALDQFYTDNGAKFSTPQFRAISLIILDPVKIAQSITLGDEELKKAYDERQFQFVRPERRHLQQILANDEAAARRAHDLLTQGKDFAAVAKEVAHQDAAATDLGWIAADALPPELKPVARSLPVGKFSDPVKTALGWHILRVAEFEAQRTLPLDEVKADLAKEIAQERASEKLYKMGTQLQDDLAGGASFDDAAKALNASVRKIEAIDASGRDRSGKAVSDLPPGVEFRAAAFSINKGEVSQLTEMASGSYFVLRVDDVIQPGVPPLAEIRDKVVQAWRTQKQMEAAEARAKSAKELIAQGKSLAAVAQGLGQSVSESKPFTRGDAAQAAKLPPDIVRPIFSGAPGTVATAKTDDGYLVVRLTRIVSTRLEAGSQRTAETSRRIKESLGGDLLVQLRTALGNRRAVDIDQKALDAIK